MGAAGNLGNGPRRWLASALALSLFLILGVAAARAETANPGSAHHETEEDPLGAEDPYAEDHIVPVPEPLVFDLVRGLGARKGELETNVLGLLPLEDASGSELLWAPEVEYAVADGIALEFELPFEGSELEAYKLAAQATLGTAFDLRTIHGALGGDGPLHDPGRARRLLRREGRGRRLGSGDLHVLSR